MLSAGEKPRVRSLAHLRTFFGELKGSFTLIAEEKEIILFAFLQWIAIIVAYLAWTQVLDWIPDELWDEVRRSRDREDSAAFALINLVLLIWSAVVIVFVSYPISLLSGAMVAAHYLRYSRQQSTIGRCIAIANNNLWRTWIFSAIDAGITADAILDRLPKKRNKRTAADELLYYSWKIGTLGVLPALVSGKSYLEAAKDSITLLRDQPLRTVGIRMGYSLFCWVVGIAAYIGSICWYFAAGRGSRDGLNEVYNFYLLMTLPIFVAVGIVSVFIRPLYLIMISKLYTDIHPELPVHRPEDIRAKKGLFLLFLAIGCVLLGAIFFRDQIGLTALVESWAMEDIADYRDNFK